MRMVGRPSGLDLPLPHHCILEVLPPTVLMETMVSIIFLDAAPTIIKSPTMFLNNIMSIENVKVFFILRVYFLFILMALLKTPIGKWFSYLIQVFDYY